ncbi:MAG: hypothetical protein COW24_05845 [Candidatus Kerfeldbacteria bacterium CG15_BIG_FIL_POST_REV_8_21_14_020_45_12]|uniref:Type II secretion system protein GspF domain-containing protein n=1 Tax=Candidatus Kerfeldbacteria bacterium CG15_BIG_FIL_POST_REV_8_21_14_020_45_12 TaxID=2014247 RepID=A0A2M7H298_9BACT|nr:MAG: hypothetical protein COW24_05845 [Candidatus Kerfeldbacteria bacterium CG15_BIG_FIL_POST_REV_8_21_14_020_45_12]PJA93724.1 MAG: hypothetical protein CO132_01640 [Candidatus Kerfeldbacteria bacterium CG_4_9_14_3_um_filter_45_8]
MVGGHAKKAPRKHLLTLSKVKTVDKIFFVQNLSVLLRAGFSLSHGLRTVSQQITQRRFHSVIEDIIVNVESGETFASALLRHPQDFDELFINMIDSGEISGKLELTLTALALQLKKSHALFLKVRNALAYPVVILVAMVFIGTGMMIFVLPKITDLYRDASQELPFITKAVIWFSDAFVNYGGFIGIGAILVIAIFMYSYRKTRLRYNIDALLLRLPIFGNIFQEINIARFSRVFHSLISTDIPIVKSFQIMAGTVGNYAYRKHLLAAVPQLETGIAIGKTLSTNKHLFPSTVVEMISVGEQSGALDEMTADLAEYYEQEAESTLDGLSVLIEPLLMLILGLGVGVIAVAVLWPMYRLVDVI